MKQVIPALLFSFFILGLTCLSAQEKYKSAVYEYKSEGVKWVYGPDFGLFALANERDSLLTGFDFEQPAPFNEGAAVVKKGALYYFIDTGGQIISEGSPFLLPSIYNTYTDGDIVYARNGHPLFYLNNCNSLFSEQMFHTLTSKNYTLTSRYRGASIEKNDSLFIFNVKDSVQGIIHQNGTIILPPKYESVEIWKSGYFKLYSEKGCGLTDITGAILLPPVYDYIRDDYRDENNIKIHLDGLYGSYNLEVLKGVDCKYYYISNFINGKAWAIRNDMYFIIDSIGNEIVIAEKKACTILEDSLLVFDKNGIKTVLNLENKTIALENASFYKKEGQFMLFKKGDGTMVYLNSEGELVLDKKYIESKLVGNNHFLVRDSTYCYGIVQSDGTVVQAPYFNHYIFSGSDYFCVALSQTDIKSFEYNSIPSSQDYLKQYDWTTKFYSENGDLLLEAKTPFHHVSRIGNYLIHLSLDTGYVYFYENKPLVKYDKNSKYDYRRTIYKNVYFNQQGEVIADAFDSYSTVDGNCTSEPCQYLEKKDYISVRKKNMVGLLNKNGKTILQPIYQKIVYIGDGFFAIYDKDKMGIADTSGKIIHGPSLDTFIYLEHKIFLIKESGKWGAKDKGGNKLAETFYDNIKLHEDGILLVKENGKYGYYCIAPIELEVVELEIIEPIRIVEDVIYKRFNKYPPSKHGDRDQYSEGMAKVVFGTIHNHKYGFINEADSLVIPIIYDQAQSFQDGLAVVEKDYKVGIIDKKGSFVVPLEYDRVDQLQNGLVIVEKNNKYGVLDQKGNFVLPIIYNKIEIHKNELLIVKKHTKYGIVNLKCNFIVSLEYDEVNISENGLVIVSKESKYGIVDQKGNFIVPLIYSGIKKFQNTLATVIKDNKYGVINQSGNWVVSLEYDDVTIIENDLVSVEKDSKYGIINKLGNFVLPIEYDDIYQFINGLILVNKDNKYGIINKTGNFIVPLEYDAIKQFENELIIVNKDSKYGIIDITGHFVVPLEHDGMNPFQNGLVIVNKDSKYGLIDKIGNFFVSVEYDGIKQFQNGLIIVNKDSKYGIMDKTGHFVVPLEHDSINPFQTGFVIVNKDRKYGLIDKIGNFVVPVEYDLIKQFQNGLAFVKKGGKWGLLNKDFAIVLPCIYDEINTENYLTLGFDLVKINGKFGLANSMGTILIPCDYDKIEVEQLLKDKFAYIHLDKRIGLMDRKGHIICTPKYDAFKGIGNRFMMVQKDKLWGAIDTFGKELISTSYQKCNFNDYRQCFMVKKNNLFGIIDTNFQMVVQPQFDTISNSLITSKKGQGMGLLDRHFQVHIPCKYQSITHLEQDKFLIGHRGLSGFVDISNAILILPTHFDEINRQADFETGYYFVKKGTKWGCVDKKGAIKVIPRFDAISCFKNGMAHVIIEPAQPIFLSYWGIKGGTSYYPPSHAQPYPRDYLINTSGELLPITVR